MSNKVDPLTEARRFSRQTRFIIAGGATNRPVHELDAVDRVCDELEALRTEASAMTARAERAERERDALLAERDALREERDRRRSLDAARRNPYGDWVPE